MSVSARVITAACGLLAATAAGSERDTATGYRYPAFDGATLDGWTVDGDCRVVPANGVLQFESGAGWLRSDHRYGNFRLSAGWKTSRTGNPAAGICFRASGPGDPVPSGGDRVDLAADRAGTIAGLAGAEASGLSRPAGKWNELELIAVGDVVELSINGRKAYKVQGVRAGAGYLGLQVDLTGGGSVCFRNLEITELGHQSLFNGRDLTGWEGAGRPASTCWDVRDGAIVCTSRGGPWLRSKRQFDDFNLRFEYLVAPGANSGIYVRVPSDGNHHRDNDTLPSAGFEVQVLDDSAPKYAELKDYQYSGSVYDIAGARQHVAKPPGEWNTLEINCDGHHVTTYHNGVEIVSTPHDSPAASLSSLRVHEFFAGTLTIDGFGSAATA